MVARKGLFRALYTDRGSHYFHTPETGGKIDKSNPTQVGRALAQLGPLLPRLRRRIEHIAAYSPEARGRSERAFATLQDRLVKELKLAGITSVEAANRFIAEDDLPDHNARFATSPAPEARERGPEQPESAFVPASLEQVRDILCRQEERTVGNDNTVSYRGLGLQIPPSPMRPHFVRAKVRVHDYPDGTMAIFHGPRVLASYTADGALIEPQDLAA